MAPAKIDKIYTFGGEPNDGRDRCGQVDISVLARCINENDLGSGRNAKVRCGRVSVSQNSAYDLAMAPTFPDVPITILVWHQHRYMPKTRSWPEVAVDDAYSDPSSPIAVARVDIHAT